MEYLFEIENGDRVTSEEELLTLSLAVDNHLNIDQLKVNREIKKRKIDVHEVVSVLKKRGVIRCIETRYDFKNTKISTGLDGVNRIFLAFFQDLSHIGGQRY